MREAARITSDNSCIIQSVSTEDMGLGNARKSKDD